MKFGLRLTIARLPFAVLLSLMFVGAANAQDATPQSVLDALRDRDVELATGSLAELFDNGLSTTDFAYSQLPAAAGGVYRAWAQLDAEDRYRMLHKWSFPQSPRDATEKDNDGQRIRLLSTPVPVSSPPKAFARAIRQRPSDKVFAPATVGYANGFFCSGWMLAQTADELGRLGRLRTELESMEEDSVDNATEFLQLTQLVGSRGDIEQVAEYLESLLEDPIENHGELNVKDMNQIAIATASLNHSALLKSAESVLQRFVDQANDAGKAIALRPFVRVLHATAVQRHRGKSDPKVLFQNAFKYWVPATVVSAKDIARGRRQGAWLAHEGHTLHVAGGEANVLFCRFPLTGDFDFICETQAGGAVGTDGGLVYGGLHFQAVGRKQNLQIWNADQSRTHTLRSTFARQGAGPLFNHVSIRSRKGKAQFESNFHPIWFDEDTGSSPWLGLRSSGTKRPVFRNFELTGHVAIPQEISLSNGDSLRGWQSNFFAESQPHFLSSEVAEDTEELPEWRLVNGVIISKPQLDSDQAERSGLLQYQRPLLPDEKIRYEFLYNENESIVHPAYGRVAFLLSPTGVRIRWITDEMEWTGIPAENTVLEPLNRRGPRAVPLKKNDWNSIVVSRSHEVVSLHLNDELIYERPLWTDDFLPFGLYRANRTCEASVRSLVLTGGWPTELPDEFLKDPFVSNRE